MTKFSEYKIVRILMSRFRKYKETEEDFVKERKQICNTCPHNTKNINKLSIKQKCLNLLSNLLTLLMTGKFNENDYACNLCHCTLIYKIPEIEETCLDNRWKSIYIQNKRKNAIK